MKNTYSTPEIDIVTVTCDDVVTTSTTVKPGGGIPLPDDEW